MFKDIKEQCFKLAEQIVKQPDGSYMVPNPLISYVEQLTARGMHLDKACGLMKSWLYSGWIPPAVVNEFLVSQDEIRDQEMAAFKKTMNEMQEWYSKLDDFLKTKTENKST